MNHHALDLLAAKAKLAGAVVLGGLVATAAVGGGALSLVADSSGTTGAPVTCVSPSIDPSTDPSTEASTAASTDPSAAPVDSTCTSPAAAPAVTTSPGATESPEAAESEAPDVTAAASPAAAETVVLNHATVVSIDATTLVVTAAGATTTWTLSPETHWTGAIKDPAQVLPGMVIHLRGTKTGDAYTADHVVTPGKNKPKHVKAAKVAKTHATKAHGKRP